MALPVETQLRYWTIAAVVFGLLLWFLGNTLMPFILGGAIAYCLDPVADWLERHGFSRIVATSIITLTAVLIFIIATLAVVPTLVNQTVALVEIMPTIIANIRDLLQTTFPALFEQSTMESSLTSLSQFVQERGGQFLNGIVASLNSIIAAMVLLVIVPVVSFYLLMDWDNMIARIDELVPRDHADTVRQLGREIDRTLASFIRGTGTVVTILACYYAIALMLAGLNFGILVGVAAGLISFIPYVGALVGGALAIGLAIFQYWGAIEVVDGDVVTYATNWTAIGIVVAIFAVGQVLEGNVLTPNLVGNSVGLHPVWLIFALSVFGSLFGFVGMLVAVPVAAMIGVVTRFFLDQYKSGRLYQGLDHADLQDQDDDDAP